MKLDNLGFDPGKKEVMVAEVGVPLRTGERVGPRGVTGIPA